MSMPNSQRYYSSKVTRHAVVVTEFDLLHITISPTSCAAEGLLRTNPTRHHKADSILILGIIAVESTPANAACSLNSF